MTEGPVLEEAPTGPVLQPATADLPMDPVAYVETGIRDEEQDEPDEELAEILADLDPDFQEDFRGLMVLGYLEEECTVAGHRFLLKTPWHDERIERGMLHKPYIGSMNFEPMWELITVATYLHKIDSEDAPEPLGPKVNVVANRLEWVKRSIYSPLVIRKIFDLCVVLDARERAVVDYVDGLSKS